MASTMASTLVLSRPSEKFGTHSTSVDISTKNSCVHNEAATPSAIQGGYFEYQRSELWKSEELGGLLKGKAEKGLSERLEIPCYGLDLACPCDRSGPLPATLPVYVKAIRGRENHDSVPAPKRCACLGG